MSALEDRLAITDLIHRYAELVDDRAVEELATLFTDPCEFRAFDSEKGVARTREEVRVMSARLLATFTRTSHHVSNTRIVADGPGRARAVTYLLAWHEFPDDRPDGYLWGRYHDVLEKRDGQWLFRERTLRVTAEQHFPFKWLPPAPSGIGDWPGDLS